MYFFRIDGTYQYCIDTYGKAFVEKYIGNLPIRQAPFNRQPTCYVIKSDVQPVFDGIKW